jgi:RIO-like serine/threonine protein kinase
MTRDGAGEPLSPARNGTKAEVFLEERGGHRVVVKTIARRRGIARAVAAFLLHREARMLRRVAGSPGVPALLEATDDSLVLEWKQGDTLFARRKSGVSPETGARIEEVVAALHARGFAHGDIGRRDVLVAADGSVALLDFATAVGAGCPPLLGRVLLPLWKRRDRARIAKMLRRYRRRWDKRAAEREERVTSRGTRAAPGG